MHKLLAMNVAAILTNSVMSNLPETLPVDADIKEGATRMQNLMAWEIFRVFYHAVIKAVDDHQSWPAPKSNYAELFQGVVEQVLPLITASGPLAEILGNWLQKPNVPNPGS